MTALVDSGWSLSRIPDRGPGQALIRDNPEKYNYNENLWIPRSRRGMTVVEDAGQARHKPDSLLLLGGGWEGVSKDKCRGIKLKRDPTLILP